MAQVKGTCLVFFSEGLGSWLSSKSTCLVFDTQVFISVYFTFIYFVYLCVYKWVWAWVCLGHTARGDQRGLFSPSTLSGPGMELRPPGLVSALSH